MLVLKKSIGINYLNILKPKNFWLLYFVSIFKVVTNFVTCDFDIISYLDKEDDPESPKVLRHVELIDDEASEYGIKIVQTSDKLMAKKYGWRNPPGITYFRKGKYINYDGDIDDEEEILDWLTDPENMELTDAIEKVNRKMFEKIRQSSDYLAVFFCKLILLLLIKSSRFKEETVLLILQFL